MSSILISGSIEESTPRGPTMGLTSTLWVRVHGVSGRDSTAH